MASIDLALLERRARARYEFGRSRDALLGVLPLTLIAAGACALSQRPLATALASVATLLAGGLALWYGRELRRAFVLGVAAGLIPLACALCSSRLGHICAGDRCVMLCLPACAIGGGLAGFVVGRVGMRGAQRGRFWFAASALAVLTGAMGCACVGFAGVAGMLLGFGAGLVPDGLRAFARSRTLPY